MEDFHIISGTDNDEKKKGSFFKYVPVLVILLLAGIVVRNITLLQKPSVEGVQTESKESIRFDTPETTVSITDSISPSITPTPTLGQKGTGTPSATKTIILKSRTDEDGFVTSSGLVGVNTAIKIGDNGTDTFRGYVSFTLDDLPQGVTISKATLRIYQTKITGNPFGMHGAIKIDHVAYGAVLNSDAYNSTSEKSAFATIPQSTSAGWKEIEVTKELKTDISNAHTRSQYRIHFGEEKVSKEGSENMVYFESASNSLGSGETPQLVVTY